MTLSKMHTLLEAR